MEEIIFDKQTNENIKSLIDKLNKKNSVTVLTYLLSMTIKYNDDIIEKYGPERLVTEITKLAELHGAKNIHNNFNKGELVLKKCWMRERNRKILNDKYN